MDGFDLILRHLSLTLHQHRKLKLSKMMSNDGAFDDKSAYKEAQATGKQECRVKKEPIIDGRSQADVMLRVQRVIPGKLLNQVEIDGVAETRRK